MESQPFVISNTPDMQVFVICTLHLTQGSMPLIWYGMVVSPNAQGLLWSCCIGLSYAGSLIVRCLCLLLFLVTCSWLEV